MVAAKDAAIHLTGANASFSNESTSESAMADLAQIQAIFEGGVTNWASYEVAGANRGLVPQGFVDNFVLGSLTVGGARPAQVRLQDLIDNGNRMSPEALYVHDLTITAGSVLDLAGLKLYYDGTYRNLGGQVLNGTPIPEPATLTLLVLGGLAVLRRKRK